VAAQLAASQEGLRSVSMKDIHMIFYGAPVLLETLIVAQLAKDFEVLFIEIKDLLLCSREPIT
jgi:hypothetical protein